MSEIINNREQQQMNKTERQVLLKKLLKICIMVEV